MSYLNCRQGHCEACNGYIGPLDTFACLHSCHDRARAARDANRAAALTATPNHGRNATT